MDLLTPEILQPLGVSAVLAVFLWLAWAKLQKKDDRIEKMTDTLIQKYEENTRATVQSNIIMEGLKGSQEKFIERFDEFVRNGHNKRK